MRPSFSRVLSAVPASAAVSGSVIASIWLLAVNPGHSQVPRVATGTSSTVVHASLPRTRGAVEHPSPLAQAGAGTPSVATVGARTGPSPALVRTTPNLGLSLVAPSAGAHATGPASAPTSPTSVPKPVSPASVPVPPATTSPGGASFGLAVAPPARKPSSSTPKGDKRSRVTKPVARVRAQAIKPSGTKKAEPGQLDKQAATKQTDGKQADGKQADTKQTDAGQSDTKQAESKQADGAKDQSAQQDGAQSNAEKGKSKAKH